MTRAPATIRSPDSAVLARALDTSSLVAARKALLATFGLAALSAGLGLMFGSIHGPDLWLVAASLTFSICALLLLIVWPLDRIGPLGISATIFFGAYLSALAIYAVLDPHNREGLLVALIWFIPLLAFNKIVNRGRAAVILARFLLAAPLLIVVGLWSAITRILPLPLLSVVIVCCLAHTTMWVMLALSRSFHQRAGAFGAFQVRRRNPGKHFRVLRPGRSGLSRTLPQPIGQRRAWGERP
jgi:hypothetical protein